MQISADEPDPVNANQYPAQANQPETNAVAPITLRGERTNIYDDPLSVFVDGGLYKVFIFLFTCISGSVIIFLRYRIGLRLVRMWSFLILFVLFGGFSLIFNGGWITLLTGSNSGSHTFDLAGFGFVMFLFALYHNKAAKELVWHPDNPLHTMARGNSYLTKTLSKMKPQYGIWFKVTPKPHIIHLQWLPLDESTIQRWVEPILLEIVGFMLAWDGSPLGVWLMFCGIALNIVESDYHIKGINHQYDERDAMIEAKVQKALHDPKYRTETTDKGGKIGGIAVVSEQVKQIRARREERRS